MLRFSTGRDCSGTIPGPGSVAVGRQMELIFAGFVEMLFLEVVVGV